ncbi:MAG TPA: response regulator [Nitrospiria bacterium]|jgi:CheY-like chemotaxis protein|nr:response regulator [Nitrospiria bacterium]
MTTPEGAEVAGKKVLVVDDEKFVRELIKIKLGRCGLAVLEASNGLEAIEMARTQRPDMILLDVMMPKMNGFEACEKLKANPMTARIPIVMLTARGEQANHEKGISLGAMDYMSKPFSPQKLAELVMEILARSSSISSEPGKQERKAP